MPILIITEKPSVARDISAVLTDHFTAKEGYLEGKEYILTWALGHLLELASPEDYDNELKAWKMGTLPIFPQYFKLVPKVSGRKQLQVVKSLVSRPDVDRIINACDAGREGELIFWYIMQYLRCKKPQDRLWLCENTAEAVKSAFDNLQIGSKFDNLAQAAIARSQADWVVGINATRGYTLQYGEKYTVGRVQTPTLSLIVNRDLQIESFKPEPYWQIEAGLSTGTDSYTGILSHGENDRFHDQQEAVIALKQMKPGEMGKVIKLEQKDGQEQPPLLYNLNDLQKDANKLYGLTADETLRTVQILYEKGLITYPRTDSRHLTHSMAATIPERLQALKHTELARFLNIPSGRELGKRYVDNSKITDHTAIISTVKVPDLEALRENERKLYLHIAKRLIAAFYPPACFLNTQVITEFQNHTFLSRGKAVVDLGWKVIYMGIEMEDEEEQVPKTGLPFLEEGQTIILDSCELMEKKTGPPKRYTEADLLSAMENAGRWVDDEELAEAMKSKGLGTPATRAAIIEKLIANGYLIRQKKNLLSTDKGRCLIDIVSKRFKDPEMTGEWEQKLLFIEQGKYHSKPFLDEIKECTAAVIEDLKKKEAIKPAVRVDCLGTCPICGQPVLENPKGYSCSAWKEGCQFVIWKQTSGRSISKGIAKKLLSDGRSALIKGFKSKQGNRFDAYLIVNQNGKISFLFPSRANERGDQ